MTLPDFIKQYITQEQDVVDKAVILKEGRAFDHVLVVASGSVKVVKTLIEGSIVMDELGAGAVIGEMLFFESELETSPVSYVADGPVRIGVVDKKRLRDEFEALSPQLKEVVRASIRKFGGTVINRIKELADR